MRDTSTRITWDLVAYDHFRLDAHGSLLPLRTQDEVLERIQWGIGATAYAYAIMEVGDCTDAIHVHVDPIKTPHHRDTFWVPAIPGHCAPGSDGFIVFVGGFPVARDEFGNLTWRL